ncbi:hypothetical protein GWI33_017434 [Rhynchophorus ferrugineus]|uniref:Uncharacterized protein n=1 Tax=Rhynchophorus ferrugineus TaxID=354439 RepID=A0A834HZA5_RHYFE|nr:hypothetical protein GWI33_017434 [Rhynchophorus ferrugineus]
MPVCIIKPVRRKLLRDVKAFYSQNFCSCNKNDRSTFWGKVWKSDENLNRYASGGKKPIHDTLMSIQDGVKMAEPLAEPSFWVYVFIYWNQAHLQDCVNMID